ncbi:MAG: serpin family protein, partial [Gemmatimonadota bacterium]|nr:serpin family protein [Gemmatimonadota bacterium]
EVMYLVNAIYFKGTWRQQFAKNRTRDDGFTTSGGVRVPVKMMHQDSTQRYLETPEFQAVDMPYGNGAFAMTVILPAPGRDAGALVASLGHERWAEWLGRFAEQRVDLYLPRFRLEYESSFNDALKALGMEIAFDDQRADFTGMASSGGIYISEVFQKTFVDVNEEGTEAAAVTKVVMGVTSAPMRASMRVDRPFIVAIRERFSGTLLFVGLIESPPT